ncbi:tRNA (guanine37-N1)-methyltransferase [Microbacterium halimionae]|uniref:tRNA (Guanine37-N1)-methyltransferase n=1 Tax=Microbacterium halimionae TaxID=1526413 RepID=A0A7W3JM99_9MICO|nr:GNAT family N-acetyltransferase [Microbacterium halimionae]MBA8815462.1 tRNA (guanine37-N1)-methyltransferase [Microbacterium halimionae]NII95509.1 tRNA (guanine37-N1)-methyltransferase [Microbacterium halimionae]
MSSHVTIDSVMRRALSGDEAALHVLAAATFPLACPPGSTESDQREFIAAHLSEKSFTQHLNDPDRVIFVDVSDEDSDNHGSFLGYTMLVFGEPADAQVRRVVTERPAAELSKCYALPSTHGTGIAAQLVAASVAEASARGARTLWLGVNEENARAQRFYAKQGFSVVGTKQFQVGSRLENDLVLARPLEVLPSQ